MERLQRWLKDKCEEQNLSWREASMKAGLNPGAISAILSGQTPGLDSCKALAKLFRVSPVFVLQLAGHLEETSNSPVFLDSRFRDIMDVWQLLTDLNFELGLTALHKAALAFKVTLEAKRKSPEE